MSQNRVVHSPRLVVLSPHLDDAVFSVGGLLAHYASQGRNVEIWTFFTSGPSSTSVPKDRQVFGNFAERCAEDARAATRLGVGYRWLGLQERVFRDPPLAKVYHVFRTPNTSSEFPNMGAIRAIVEPLLLDSATDVLAPLGVGNHYDHVEVALSVFQSLLSCEAFDRLGFYEDIYALGGGCRRRHFVTRRRLWKPLDAPAWASPRLGALLAHTAWVARGPGVDAYVPAVGEFEWTCLPQPVAEHEMTKLAALAEYRSQVNALGGMRFVGPFLQRAHAACGGEPLWRASKPSTMK